jgi:hypothetical protein
VHSRQYYLCELRVCRFEHSLEEPITFDLEVNFLTASMDAENSPEIPNDGSQPFRHSISNAYETDRITAV